MKSNILKYGLLAFFWLSYTLPAFADPNDPDPSEDPPAAPVDNWIMILAIIAVGLGVYFLSRNRKKQFA